MVPHLGPDSNDVGMAARRTPGNSGTSVFDLCDLCHCRAYEDNACKQQQKGSVAVGSSFVVGKSGGICNGHPSNHESGDETGCEKKREGEAGVCEARKSMQRLF